MANSPAAPTRMDSAVSLGPKFHPVMLYSAPPSVLAVPDCHVTRSTRGLPYRVTMGTCTGTTWPLSVTFQTRSVPQPGTERHTMTVSEVTVHAVTS